MNTKWISVLALAGFIAAPAVASTITDSAPSVPILRYCFLGSVSYLCLPN